MGFQIDEKMMASNRAIITRNKTQDDLIGIDEIKFKPGMMHYIADSEKLFLSTTPVKIKGKDGKVKTRNLLEVITDKRLEEVLKRFLGQEQDITIANDDCNKVMNTGFYFGSDFINGPEGQSGAMFIQAYKKDDQCFQTIRIFNTERIYTRSCIKNVWSKWSKTVEAKSILEDGINIILQSTEPSNIKNKNTYWLEIIN